MANAAEILAAEETHAGAEKQKHTKGQLCCLAATAAGAAAAGDKAANARAVSRIVAAVVAAAPQRVVAVADAVVA